jgi:hypothetical protein
LSGLAFLHESLLIVRLLPLVLPLLLLGGELLLLEGLIRLPLAARFGVALALERHGFGIGAGLHV